MLTIKPSRSTPTTVDVHTLGHGSSYEGGFENARRRTGPATVVWPVRGGRIYGHGLELEWVYAEEIHQSLLVERGVTEPDSGGLVFGAAKTYSDPKSLSSDRFALWWQERNRLGMGGIQFRVFDARGLVPIQNWRDSWHEKSDYAIGAPEVASLSIPARLTDGVNTVPLPEEFSDGGEVYFW